MCFRHETYPAFALLYARIHVILVIRAEERQWECQSARSREVLEHILHENMT